MSTHTKVGPPVAAASKHTHTCMFGIHMCVAEYINSELHLSVKGYNALADQLLLREHTCDMCGPGAAASIHMCVSEKNQIHSGLHPRIKGCIWPTNCGCEHTHVCGRIVSTQSLHPWVEMSQRLGRPRAAASIHVEYVNSGLHLNIKESMGTGFGRPVAAVSTHTHVCRRTSQASTCVLQNQSIQGSTQGSMATGGLADLLLRTSAHMSVAEQPNFRAPPKDQG